MLKVVQNVDIIPKNWCLTLTA